MLICDKCGKVIADNERPVDVLRHYDEFDGTHCIHEEYFEEECECGGWYEEAHRCKICGEWTKNEFVCDKCIEKNTNFDTIVKYGAHIAKRNCGAGEVCVNDFFQFLFDEIDINSILCDYARKYVLENSKELKEYIDNDPDYFGEFLALHAKGELK